MGVLGGTLDPIHVGHLAAANAAINALNLDEVLIVPAGQPWQKDGRVFANAPDRLTMASLATADNPRLTVSDVDVRRPGPTYTVDTLIDVRREEPPSKWWFIVGADAFVNLPTWHQAERLGGLATFAVVPRTGISQTAIDQTRERMQSLAAPVQVDLVSMPEVKVSSSQVRELIACGEAIDNLVPPSVADYISQHGLYAKSPAQVAS